ncbi:MAG: choice-of-anchor J domain-containing protein [Clostridia bacterium]|nr:choice-of-anchor J domain-containing protein [Clostridia bacterium]
MKLKRFFAVFLILALCLSLCSMAAFAASTITLPYSYDFSDASELNNWKLIYHASSDSSDHSGIYNDYGNNLFRFYYMTKTYGDNYLISPEISGGSAVTFSFRCKAGHKSYSESLTVGYSTTNNDVGSFTFLNTDIDIQKDDEEWHTVSESFPAGTKYVAIRYYEHGDDSAALFIDDISITEDSVTDYDLYVAGTQVTSANAADLSVISGVSVAPGGEASYDASANTLTLNGATITGLDSASVSSYDEDGGIVYAGSEAFTINVTGGDSVITGGNTNRNSSSGLFIGDPNDVWSYSGSFNVGINIADGASLTLTGGVPETTYAYAASSGLHSMTTGTLTVSGAGTLNANGGASIYSYGLIANGSLVLSDSGSVNAKGADAGSFSCGITAYDVYVNGMTVIAQSGSADTESGGILVQGGWMNRGDVTITAGSVTAEAGTASLSRGIVFDKDMTVSGGTAKASGNTVALSKPPVLGSGVTAGGSADADGSGAVPYNSDDNASYKWVQIPFDPAVSSVELDGSKAVVTLAKSGAGHTLYLAGYTASGQMLEVFVRAVQSGVNEYAFTLNKSAAYVKVFLTDGDARPLCESVKRS